DGASEAGPDPSLFAIYPPLGVASLDLRSVELNLRDLTLHLHRPAHQAIHYKVFVPAAFDGLSLEALIEERARESREYQRNASVRPGPPFGSHWDPERPQNTPPESEISARVQTEARRVTRAG